MSYQVFARKYRPQSFDEVLGQEAAVTTLKNAIALNRIHHAYLFCGARGVGKTSLARIFAKSINCEKGPTAEPCQECSNCKAITQGSFMDVLEIDGASNTGVDDVRELREQAKYLPASGKHKVYIIDEVHMLSTSAFNALLKILEEPPAHILFVFATTEPHKIPITILSRCQRFDLKRLSPVQLVGHLKKILASEKLKIDDEGLSLIAHCGDGSVRDSLSLLDQIVSFCGNEVPLEKIREILGLADRSVLFEMAAALLNASVPDALQSAQGLFERGADLKIFSEGLLETLRNLLVLKEGGAKFVDLPPGDLDALNGLLAQADTSQLLMMFQILSRATEEIARSDFPRLLFEAALIKMTHVKEYLSIPQILEEIRGGTAPTARTAPLTPTPAPTRSAAPASATASAATSAARPKTAAPSNPLNQTWVDFVKYVLQNRPQVGSLLEHGRCVDLGADKIVLGFEPASLYVDMLKDRIPTVNEMASGFFNRPLKIELKTLAASETALPSALEMRQKEEFAEEELMKAKALANPAVQKAQEILGAKVKEIKPIR